MINIENGGNFCREKRIRLKRGSQRTPEVLIKLFLLIIVLWSFKLCMFILYTLLYTFHNFSKEKQLSTIDKKDKRKREREIPEND